MALTKCPRCELNYILDAGDLCIVCREEVRGKRADDGLVMCSVCGEIPALTGEDMCRACLTEMRAIEIVPTAEDEETAAQAAELDPEPVSSLDEIEAVDAIEGETAEEEIELEEVPETEAPDEAEPEVDDLPIGPGDYDDMDDYDEDDEDDDADDDEE